MDTLEPETEADPRRLRAQLVTRVAFCASG